ncbi:hypothetical protein LZ30DRAFT_250024 [Colletotrichum cereale]|nr:hypothetical protein LZ30DRAFT_250024 [Colletotrichum cereale]
MTYIRRNQRSTLKPPSSTANHRSQSQYHDRYRHRYHPARHWWRHRSRYQIRVRAWVQPFICSRRLTAQRCAALHCTFQLYRTACRAIQSLLHQAPPRPYFRIERRYTSYATLSLSLRTLPHLHQKAILRLRPPSHPSSLLFHFYHPPIFFRSTVLLPAARAETATRPLRYPLLTAATCCCRAISLHPAHCSLTLSHTLSLFTSPLAHSSPSPT